MPRAGYKPKFAGVIGKPLGPGKPEKVFSEMLRIAVQRAYHKGGTKLWALANALIAAGIKGDVMAIREIADRLEGKVAQQIGGDPENPVLIAAVERVIVRAAPHEAAPLLDANRDQIEHAANGNATTHAQAADTDGGDF